MSSNENIWEVFAVRAAIIVGVFCSIYFTRCNIAGVPRACFYAPTDAVVGTSVGYRTIQTTCYNVCLTSANDEDCTTYGDAECWLVQSKIQYQGNHICYRALGDKYYLNQTLAIQAGEDSPLGTHKAVKLPQTDGGTCRDKFRIEKSLYNALMFCLAFGLFVCTYDAFRQTQFTTSCSAATTSGHTGVSASMWYDEERGTSVASVS